MLSALIPYLYFVLLVYLRVIFLYILSHSITMFGVVKAHLFLDIFSFSHCYPTLVRPFDQRLEMPICTYTPIIFLSYGIF